MRAYYAANKLRLDKQNRQWALGHPEKVRQHKRDWKAGNYQYHVESGKEYRKRCATEINARARAKYHANLEKRREQSRRNAAKYRQKYPERVAVENARWKSLRRANDPLFRARHNLRGKLWKALKRNQKAGSTLQLLGCSLPEFRNYIEGKFVDGMTWENYGKIWVFDHIIPCAAFDFRKPDDQRRCFHYTNIQPLFAMDNLRKGAKQLGVPPTDAIQETGATAGQ